MNEMIREMFPQIRPISFHTKKKTKLIISVGVYVYIPAQYYKILHGESSCSIQINSATKIPQCHHFYAACIINVFMVN